MAVNTITFGEVNSADYGIYISGEGVFNAPVRDAEVISIPGRNGSFLLDNGRYENIEVTYPAFNTETDKATFIAQIDAFRNAIASQKGYQRLEDTFHTDEYRMASFIGGLEINPVLYNDHTSQFEIVFNCKPQRFLKSGETEITIPSQGSGYNLTNPTLFEAKPLLMVEGYGDINIGDQVISIDNVVIGDVLLSNGARLEDTTTGTLADMVTVGVAEFDQAKVNTGDTITLKPTAYTINIAYNNLLPSEHVEAEVTNQSGVGESSGGALSRTTASYTVNMPAVLFTVGTSASVQHSASWIFRSVSIYGGYSETTFPMVFNIAYDGANKITITAKHWYQAGATVQTTGSTGDLTGYSTVLVDGTIYIDLDIGEAYWIKDGTVISANYTVHLGADLPTLKPGVNNITYTTRITSLKIVPRWWKV